MPLLTVGYPMEKWDTDANQREDREIICEMIDQLRHILCNLDAGNVIEAAKVKAQNIDVTQAQIQDAQIGSLTADKIWTGTLDSGVVTISDKSSTCKISITGSYIHFEEGRKDRAGMGYLPDGTFVFYINDPTGKQVQIGLDSDGNAIFRGNVVGGSITSDTSINVTTDATIGNKLILKDGNDAGGYISIFDGQSPALVMRAEGSRPVHISTGDGTIQLECTGGKTYLRGKNELRLGTTDGNDRVYINNELAAMKKDILEAIDKHIQEYH